MSQASTSVPCSPRVQGVFPRELWKGGLLDRVPSCGRAPGHPFEVRRSGWLASGFTWGLRLQKVPCWAKTGNLPDSPRSSLPRV